MWCAYFLCFWRLFFRDSWLLHNVERWARQNIEHSHTRRVRSFNEFNTLQHTKYVSRDFVNAVELNGGRKKIWNGTNAEMVFVHIFYMSCHGFKWNEIKFKYDAQAEKNPIDSNRWWGCRRRAYVIVLYKKFTHIYRFKTINVAKFYS